MNHQNNYQRTQSRGFDSDLTTSHIGQANVNPLIVFLGKFHIHKQYIYNNIMVVNFYNC